MVRVILRSRIPANIIIGPGAAAESGASSEPQLDRDPPIPTTPPQSDGDAQRHHGTPRVPRISTPELSINPKQRGRYTRVANNEMKERYHLMKVEEWFMACLRGSDLSKEDLEEVGDFSHVKFRASNEPDTYVPLVRIRCIPMLLMQTANIAEHSASPSTNSSSDVAPGTPCALRAIIQRVGS